MLLDTKVLVRWNGRNKEYYISKGYKFTQNNDLFWVDIEDLNPSSHTMIKVICDNCGELFEIEYRNYCNRKIKEDICNECMHKKYNIARRGIRKIRESFADFGIKNLGNDFIEKYWSNKNNINPYDVSFGSETKVWIKCQEKDYHNDYLISCCSFSNGQRCPECSKKIVNINDSVGKYIEELFGKSFVNKIWSNKNIKSPYEVSLQSGECFWFKCINNEHDDYFRRCADAVNRQFSCPSCIEERKESILQEKVRLYLESKSLEINHEYDCNIIPINPNTKRKLPFDNEVVNYNLICEVIGIQHYYITGFHILSARNNNTTPEDELKYQQEKDLYKKNYALSHGYYYLDIPYWTEKDDKYKELIDNKLREMEKVCINK